MYVNDISSLPVLEYGQVPTCMEESRQFHVQSPGSACAVVTRRINLDIGPVVAARISGQDRGMQALSSRLVELLGNPIVVQEGFYHDCRDLRIQFYDVLTIDEAAREEKLARRNACVGNFYELSTFERRLLALFNHPSFRRQSLRDQFRRVLTTPIAKTLGPERVIQLLVDLRIWELIDEEDLPRGYFTGDEPPPFHRYRFVD